ncbi:MAG: adenosylmethionine decarboxylase [Patescibacteria group bacterium]
MTTTNTEGVEQFGVHFMMDGYGASEETLKNKALLTNMLNDIPKAMGMHVINEPVVVEVGPKNRKDPGGISGFVMIAESHISFHTFPARGFVTIDVYTCQNDLDTDKLQREFTEAFKVESSDVHIQKRGTRYPAENIYN